MTHLGSAAIGHALARQLAGVLLVHDVPFHAGEKWLGVILPERDWDRVYADAEIIVQSLSSATLTLDDKADPCPIIECIDLSVGLGVYSGKDQVTIADLVRAAEDSLRISHSLAGLADLPPQLHAMPATPVIEANLILTGEG